MYSPSVLNNVGTRELYVILSCLRLMLYRQQDHNLSAINHVKHSSAYMKWFKVYAVGSVCCVAAFINAPLIRNSVRSIQTSPN